MATKPLIGVNVDYRSARKDSPAYCFLQAGYCNSLIKAGAVPMLIPPLDEDEDIQRVLNLCDGILLRLDQPAGVGDGIAKSCTLPIVGPSSIVPP